MTPRPPHRGPARPRPATVSGITLLLLLVATALMIPPEMAADSEAPTVAVPASAPAAPAPGDPEPARLAQDPSTHSMLLAGPAAVPAVGEGNLINFALLGTTRLAPRQPPGYTPVLDELDGRTVRIAGFMQAFDDLETMRNFMLMPTPGSCTFCAPPGPSMVVLVRQDIPEGGFAPFVTHPVLVEGRLKLWRRGSQDPAHRMFLYIVEEARVSRFDSPAPTILQGKGSIVAPGAGEAAGEAR
jgi:hypothetical protein